MVENKIICLICGKKYHQLSMHLARIHNIDIKEYKTKYPNAKIISDYLLNIYLLNNSGKNAPMYGKHHSKEWKKNHSKRMGGKNHPMFGIKGENHFNFGKHHSEESKKKIKKFWTDEKKEIQRQNNIGENNPAWKGGFDSIRSYLIPKNQCIKLNTYFKGSNAHHLMSGVVVYIPKDIHKINHNIRTNLNMNKINGLAYNYLIGEY